MIKTYIAVERDLDHKYIRSLNPGISYLCNWNVFAVFFLDPVLILICQ